MQNATVSPESKVLADAKCNRYGKCKSYLVINLFMQLLQ